MSSLKIYDNKKRYIEVERYEKVEMRKFNFITANKFRLEIQYCLPYREKQDPLQGRGLRVNKGIFYSLASSEQVAVRLPDKSSSHKKKTKERTKEIPWN